MQTVAVALVAIVAIAVVVAELSLRRRGVQWLANTLAQEMHARVAVHITGLPLLWRLLLRHILTVEVRATRMSIADHRSELDRLTILLDDVRLVGPWRALSPTFGRARFVADLDWAKIAPLVPLPPYLRGLEVTPAGLRLMTLAGVAVDARIELRPRELLIRPVGGVLRLLPQQNVSVDLPALPFGAVIREVRLRTGAATVSGTIDEDALAQALRRTP